jgi:hypothetical protein
VLPLAADRRRLRAHVRPQPLDQDLTTLIDPPPLFESARINTGQTGMTLHFCRKPPELFGFHKNTLPQW